MIQSSYSYQASGISKLPNLSMCCVVLQDEIEEPFHPCPCHDYSQHSLRMAIKVLVTLRDLSISTRRRLQKARGLPSSTPHQVRTHSVLMWDIGSLQKWLTPPNIATCNYQLFDGHDMILGSCKMKPGETEREENLFGFEMRSYGSPGPFSLEAVQQPEKLSPNFIYTFTDLRSMQEHSSSLQAPSKLNSSQVKLVELSP